MPNKKPFYKKWWFWVLVIIIIIAIAAIAGSRTNQNTTVTDLNSTSSTPSDNTSTSSTPTASSSNPGFSDTFSFDNLSLTFLPSYSFTVLNNQFSDANGQTVLVLPLTIKNDSTESKNLNMYSYHVFGPNGTELESESAYFMDDSADFAGKLQPGASYTKNLYVLFDGNGTYKIEFGIFNTEVTVDLDIVQQ